MRAAVHGMPRIGARRELKFALEDFWAGRIEADELHATGAAIRRHNWEALARAHIDFVPCNDFSLYDHVLDAAVAVGAIPERFGSLSEPVDLIRYFAMARGSDLGDGPRAPLDLTKWFDTNYHHLVPEIAPDTMFAPDTTKIDGELAESAALGILTTPALVGPLTLMTRSTPGGIGPKMDAMLDRLAVLPMDLVDGEHPRMR